MDNNWDEGIQEDFNNMTTELGRECLVYTRNDVLTYEGQESDLSTLNTGVAEVLFMQELDSTNEAIAAGILSIGDVRFEFLSDSIVEEEGYVSPDNGTTMYKVLKLTKVRNQTNNTIMYIKGYGAKVPNR